MKKSEEITGVYLKKCYCSECKWVVSPHDIRPFVDICPDCGTETQYAVGQYIYREITYRWFEIGSNYNEIIGFKLKEKTDEKA